METFLYNTITKKQEGPIRQGRYLVDGEPGVLPENWVELTIKTLPDPSYDYNTQTLEYREYIDLANFFWVKESYVRNLTTQEIENRIPKPPDTCTPRQFRLALLESNIEVSTIESLLNNISDPKERRIALIEWEYSIEIKRNHPLISTMAIQLNITNEQVDEIFVLANTFE